MSRGTRVLVAALIVVLIAAGFAIAYLVGRESTRTPEEAPAALKPATKPAVAETAPRPDPDDRPGDLVIERGEDGVLITDRSDKGEITERDGQVLIRSVGAPGPVSPAAASTPPTGAESPDPRPAPTDAGPDVRAYLLKMETLQAGPAGINPKNFADTLIKDASRGQTDKLDDLVRDVKRVRQEASGIDPPGPCEEHHRLVLEVLDENIAVLEEMTRAISRSDMNALTLLAGRAKALQAKVQKLELVQQALEREHGGT